MTKKIVKKNILKKRTTTPIKKRTIASVKKKIIDNNDIRRIGYVKREFQHFDQSLKGTGMVAHELGNGMISVDIPVKDNLDLIKSFTNQGIDIRNQAAYDSIYDDKDFSAALDFDVANTGLFGDNIPANNKTGGNNYLSKDAFILESFGNYGYFSSFRKDPGIEMIRIAQDLAKKDHLVGEITEMCGQFSNSNLILSGKKKDVEFYKQWMRSMKFRKVLGKIFRGYYIHGNVTILRFKTPVLARNVNLIKDRAFISKFYEKITIEEIINSKFAGTKREIAAKKNIWSRRQMPMMYIVVDPLKVENRVPSIMGLTESYYQVDEDLIKAVKVSLERKPGKIIDPRFKNLNTFPRRFLERISELNKYKNQKILLDDSFAVQIFRGKEDWEKYARPMSWRSIPHVHMKNKLREMDLRTINGVINKILQVTIGSPERPATPKQMKHLSNVLKTNAKVMTLIWNHTLKMAYIEPNLDSLNIEKYGPVNRDIKESFASPDALLGGSEQKAFSNTFIEVKSFMEKLSTGREDVLDDFVINEFELIAEAMQFDSIPDVKFEPIRLRDENKLFDQLMKLVASGGISVRTMSELTGHNWVGQEKQRLKEEKQMRDDGILPSVGVPGAKTKEGKIKPDGGRPETESDEDIDDDGEPKKEIIPKEKNAAKIKKKFGQSKKK